MSVRLTRRDMLKTGSVALLGAAAQPFTGIPALAAYATNPAVRRNAFTMANNDPILVGYRKAITAMRALPTNNPCSWTYQAAIHGTTQTPVQTAWNTCHTDSRFFWAWHRMYLYWFERIVRKYSGMYDWALPFWDWANPLERQLPPAFRVAGSALHDPSRNSALNDGTGSIWTSLGTAVTNAYALLDFYNAQSAINGPHGSVHVAISGNMCCLTSAAQDPIFWLHHSAVDRQWNLWLAQGGGRSSPVGDADWRNTTFTFFDECCQEVKMKGCGVLRAAKQLDYTYECEPPRVEQYCSRRWIPKPPELVEVARVRKPFTLSGRVVSQPLTGDRGVRSRVQEILRNSGQSAVLKLTGVEAKEHPGASWEVYVGPEGLQPNPASPYFVGMLGLFGAGIQARREHYRPAEFAFPINRALWGATDASKLQVILVPVSGLEAQGRSLPAQVRADVNVAAMTIVVDRAMEQPPQSEQDELRNEEQAERFGSAPVG